MWYFVKELTNTNRESGYVAAGYCPRVEYSPTITCTCTRLLNLYMYSSSSVYLYMYSPDAHAHVGPWGTKNSVNALRTNGDAWSAYWYASRRTYI